MNIESSKFDIKADCSKSQPSDDKSPCNPFQIMGTHIISEIAETRVVKFWTQIGYIKCYQKDGTTHHPKRAMVMVTW